MNDLYKILVIDLESRNYYVDYIENEINNFYMGGFGLSLYWLSNNPDTIDSFIISTSAIINFSNPICKYIIMRKDSIGKLVYSSMGGDFSDFLKTNDYDCIVLLNNASILTDLYIENDNIIFHENKMCENHTNSSTYDYLRRTFGNDISSIYITESALRNNRLARLISDKYRGISKNMANLLAEKNIKSISVKKSDQRSIKEVQFNNPNNRCKGCITGCRVIRKNKSRSIFDAKSNYDSSDMARLNMIRARIDEYGIDIFSLSKSIEYAYENLNDVYQITSLDLNSLDYISKNIVTPDRSEIYSDLANGVDYLRNKYEKTSLNKKPSRELNDNMKIIDSAGLCLFSVDPNDLDDIRATINRLTDVEYKSEDLISLLKRIEKIESSLD